MDIDMGKQYGTKEIAVMLGVEPVTVRKYSVALEKAGYIIERSGTDRRIYTEKSVTAFNELKALRFHNALSLEAAAMIVASRNTDVAILKHNENNSGSEALQMQYEKRFIEIESKMNNLIDINKDLIDRLDQRDIWESERDRQITEILIELREGKKQLAVTNEKKSWIHRWFKKKQ